MDPTPEIILSVIDGLRDQSGEGLKLAHQTFEDLKKNVNSIFCLFDIIMSTNNTIIKQHSIILLEHTFSACAAQIDNEIMNGIKEKVMDILINETDPTFLSTIIYELQIILKNYPSEWPELLELTYTRQGSLLLTLMLMRVIISCYKDSLTGKDEFTAQLLTDGITSADIYIIRSTLQLMAEFENQKIITRAQLMQFSPEVTEILTETIQRKNPDEYDKLFPVLIQHDSLFLFPFESAYSPLTEVLSDDSSQIGIKTQAQMVLNLYFYQEEVPREVIATAPQLLEIEISIYEAMLRSGEANIEPYFKSTLSCICQLPVPQVQEIFGQLFDNLQEAEDSATIATGVFFLSAALSFVPEAFDDILGNIFAVILECLGHDDEIVRNAAAEALTSAAPAFCDYISGNLSETLEMVLFYMGARTDEACEAGPLSAVVRCAESVDDVVEDLFAICLEQVAELAPSRASFEYISTIEVLLAKYRNFGEVGDSLFAEIDALVGQNAQQFSHLLLADVAAFCCIAQMDGLGEERARLLETLAACLDDEEIRAEAVGAIKHAAIGGILDEQWTAEFSARLLDIIEAGISADNTADSFAADTLGLAMDAYICLSKGTEQGVGAVSTTVSLIREILELPFPEHVHALMFQCLCDLCVTISKLEHGSDDEVITADLKAIVDLSFGTHLERDFGSVLSFLATAIEMNVVPFMPTEEQRLLENLPELMGQFEHAVDGQENALSKMTAAVHAILKRSEPDVIQNAAETILPAVAECLAQDDERIQMNAFLVFTQLLDVFPPDAVPEDLTEMVYALIAGTISAGRPSQATAVASSITALVSFHTDTQSVTDFVNPRVEEWGALIMQRMAANDEETSSTALMRESLVAMLCRLPADRLLEGLSGEEILDAITAVCPITRCMGCANHILMHIPTVGARVSLERKVPLLGKLVRQFSLPEYKIRMIGVEGYVLLSIGNWMYLTVEKLGEEGDAVVREAVGGDEFRAECAYVFMEHCWQMCGRFGNGDVE